ncbi:MAG: InlB B-repeat-containing protein [Olsenella sp.]|nr:InlB B-repeat-containing protein [Olsenella sp.]
MQKSRILSGATAAATTLALTASLVPAPALAEAVDATGQPAATDQAQPTSGQQAADAGETSEATAPAATSAGSAADAAPTTSQPAASTPTDGDAATTASETTSDAQPTETSQPAATAARSASPTPAEAPTATGTVTLDANGGTSAATVAAGSPLPAATRDGYVFLGWTLDQRADVEGSNAKEKFTVDWWEGDAAPADGEHPQSINYGRASAGTLHALWAKTDAVATVYGFISLNKPQTGTLPGDIAAKTSDSASFDTQHGAVIDANGNTTVTLRSYLDTTLVKKQLASAGSSLSYISGAVAEFPNPTAVTLRQVTSRFTVSYTLDGLTNPTGYTLRELTGGTLAGSSVYAIDQAGITTSTDPSTGIATVTVPITLTGSYASFDELRAAINGVGKNLVLDMDATVANQDGDHVIKGTVGGTMSATAVFSRGRSKDGSYYTYKYAIPFTFEWTGEQGDFPEVGGGASDASGSDSTLGANDAKAIQLTLRSHEVVPTPTPTPNPEPTPEPTPTPTPEPTPTPQPAGKASVTVTRVTRTQTKAAAKHVGERLPQTSDATTSPVPFVLAAFASLAAALGLRRRRR